MRKFLSIILISTIVLVLAACNGGDKQDENANHEDDELAFLEVEFEVPESATVGETVELKATVTLGDEAVKDAQEMQFEIWLAEDEDGDMNENTVEDMEMGMDNSDMIDATNNDDGTYTIQYTFEEAGEYEMYAHTTARDMHIMPKRKITITE